MGSCAVDAKLNTARAWGMAAGATGLGVSVLALRLMLHRARVQPPVRVGSSDSGYVAGTRRKQLVCEVGEFARTLLTRPDAFSFCLQTRFSHHPRPKEGSVALFRIGSGHGPHFVFRHEPLSDIEHATDWPLVLEIDTDRSVRRERKEPQLGGMRDVEVDVVVRQRWLASAPVLELELLRRRARKPRQKITKDSPSYHEAPRQNWRKVVGAPALFHRKSPGEIRVARVRYLERRYPHLHFFRHQLKRSQRSLPLHFHPKLSIAPRSERD